MIKEKNLTANQYIFQYLPLLLVYQFISSIEIRDLKEFRGKKINRNSLHGKGKKKHKFRTLLIEIRGKEFKIQLKLTVVA